MKKINNTLLIILFTIIYSTANASDIVTSKEYPISSNISEVIFGLLLVIASIFLLSFFLKKINTFKKFGASSMHIVAGMSVGTKERVLVVQVGDEQILLGVTPNRIQYLHTLKEPIKDNKSSNNNFSKKLNEFIGKGAR